MRSNVNIRAAQLALVVLLVLVGYYWWTHTGPPGALTHDHPVEEDSSQVADDSFEGQDPVSGLDWVAVEELPAQAAETIAAIKSGGPFPYDRDGVVFGNFEGILPDRSNGYYREYTVPTPGSADRGARRIVVGTDGEFYWTSDHYRTFQRIENP